MKKILFITLMLFCLKSQAQKHEPKPETEKTEAEKKAEVIAKYEKDKTDQILKMSDKDKKKFAKYEANNAVKLAKEIAEKQLEVETGRTIAGNRTNYYNAQVLNTNFNIPMLRVNFLVDNPNAAENKKASVSLFNSIGAGIGYSWGRLERTTNAEGTVISQEMTNYFGFQLGALFAAGGGGTNATTTTVTDPSTPGTSTTTINTSQPSTNIFALTASISVLNFQFGGGYELGTLTPGHRRGFVTIAYSIPLSALVKGGFLLVKKKPVPAENINDSFR